MTSARTFPAEITDINQETDKIKTFRLYHGNEDYTFSPGQWIDLYAPIEGKNIGGYTITSSIKDKGYIELAVRESANHPVTQFLHRACVGQKVIITEGQGKFFLPRELHSSALTFIAGGIGVTPLLSMFRSLDQSKCQLKFFYSASNEKDLLYPQELAPFAIFTTTKGKKELWSHETTRVDLAMLKKYQVDFQSHFFICGPREMIDSLVHQLKEYGVPSSHLHFEKWW